MQKTSKNYGLYIMSTMCTFKKLAVTIVVGILSTLTFAGLAAAATESVAPEVRRTINSYEQVFVISAYYSPLPGQIHPINGTPNYYATNSYERDLILNGYGVRGASGVPVRPGMVAAPPEFPFGTKMFIPGIGMTEVLDRGGAIKNNRLDVWFGYGSEALYRALQFGKRSVLVTVYGINDSIITDVDFHGEFPASIARPAEDPFKFKNTLEKGSRGESVARLQQFLADMGYFDGKIDGVYADSTEDAIAIFQGDQGLLDNPDLQSPGTFGVVTLERMEAILGNGREKFLERVPDRNMGRGATGDEVKKLQKALKLLGYDVQESGVYDAETVEAVFSFQLNEAVVKSQNDTGAGYFGPKTQAKMDRLMAQLDSAGSLDIKEEVLVANVDAEEAQPIVLELGTAEEAAELAFSGLEEGSKGTSVKELQELLIELNYLRIDATDYYGPLTAHAVFKLQQRAGLVSEKTDSEAGRVGLATAKLLHFYQTGEEPMTTEFVALASARTLKKGMRGGDVKKLQEFLKAEGYFPGAYTTEYFGAVTKDALMKWQLDNGLINSFSDLGAGVFNQSSKAVVSELA